jgi:energy-coupling factor transporter transmembrane protein EcfT
MRRLAIASTIATGLLLILGLADWLTNYNWSNDQDPLFGNPHILLNDGATVLVATGFLAIVTALLWALALRKDRGH